MKRERRLPAARRLLLGLCVAVVAAGAAGLTAGPAAAKSYSIEKVRIDATVQPNGDVRITDTRTLDFDGSFRYVYWDLALKRPEGFEQLTREPVQIDVLGASGPAPGDPGKTVPYALSQAQGSGEPGTAAAWARGDVARVQLNFDVGDATVPFAVEYVVRGAAGRWSDTAELYWQFIGKDVGVESRDVRVDVHLPTGVTRDQVRAWAHGPLWGDVTIQPDASVTLAVDPLPASTFVEGRILFPAAVLSKATASTTPRLDQVLAEEKKLADEANRSRLWARVKVVLWSLLGIGVPLLAVGLVLVLYLRHGREPKTEFRAQYLRDLPQPHLPPALAAYIWRMGGSSNSDVTATLLDLVNRKVIDLERVVMQKDGLFRSKEETTYKLILRDEGREELLPYERQLCSLLFHDIAGGDELVLSELKGLAKKNHSEFASGYLAWRIAVIEEGKRRRFLDATAGVMSGVARAVAILAAVAAFVAALVSGFYWFFAGVPVGIALMFLAGAIKRRSQEAAELHAQYAALERYLKDFGRLDEKPPDAVVLWEHFLIYAVVFGIADQVVKTMTVKVPEVVTDPGFSTPYMLWWGAPGDGGGLSAFSEIHQSFSSAVSVATSSESSGGGGGGGFSGGGGGGGGGGGFGAG